MAGYSFFNSRQEVSQAMVDFAELVDTMVGAMGGGQAVEPQELEALLSPRYSQAAEAESRSQCPLEDILEGLGVGIEGLGSGEDAALEPMSERAETDVEEMVEAPAAVETSLGMGDAGLGSGEGRDEGMGMSL